MPAALLGQNKSANPEDMKVKTAFMILITENGDYVLETNINSPIVPDRSATASDVEQAVNALHAEFNAQRIAGAVVGLQMNLARQAAEAQQSQQILASLNQR